MSILKVTSSVIIGLFCKVNLINELWLRTPDGMIRERLLSEFTKKDYGRDIL